jgi:RNA polymerase sigma-70 factor (ECF subfamily)
MNADMEQTVQLAKEGNRNAMKILYDSHRKQILHLAYKYVRNIEDAEEILQDTFTKAYIALKKNKLKENGRFSSWLYRIGINVSIDLVRKQKKQAIEQSEESFTRQQPESSATTPEEESMRQEMKDKIDQAIQKLAPKQRMIFTLKHFQHLKIREIAGHLNCSEGNVKKQLFRAVNTIKQELKPDFLEQAHEM